MVVFLNSCYQDHIPLRLFILRTVKYSPARGCAQTDFAPNITHTRMEDTPCMIYPMEHTNLACSCKIFMYVSIHMIAMSDISFQNEHTLRPNVKRIICSFREVL